MKNIKTLCLITSYLVTFAGILSGNTHASAADINPDTDVIAFLHVTIIPMDSERTQPDHTVIIKDRRIVEIGPTSEIAVPTDAFRIDAAGQYLMPALNDMHVHLLGVAWNILLPPDDQVSDQNMDFGRFLFPFVANGITTVQVLSATPDHITLRDRIDHGEILGPRLILAPMIDGPEKAWPPPLSTWVSSASEAQRAVQEAHEAGYDKIKVYSFLSQESYDAIIATANDLDMDVIGHIPMSLSLEYVLDAGQILIAHSEEVMKHAGEDFSEERIDYLANTMVSRDVWMTPTLVTTRSIIGLFDEPDRELSRTGTEYFQHPMQQGVWSFIFENLYRPIPDEVQQNIRIGYEDFQRPFTKAFHDKGGKLMTGTDTPLPGLVPGFALHRELRELVDIGLSPFEALRTSTTGPFEYLGEFEKAGTIEVGKQPDMLLLNENPLVDISAASKIVGVLIRGRWLDRIEIQNGLMEVRAAD